MKEKIKKTFGYPAAIWSLCWVAFQLWVVLRGSYSALVMRPIHTCFAIGLVFLSFPMLKKHKVAKGQPYFPQWYEYIFFAATMFCCIYMVINGERWDTRMPFVDPLTFMDKLVAWLIIILLIECSRRAVNMALTIIVLIFIAYGFWGEGLPGMFAHSNMSIPKFLEVQVFSTSGIWGSPVSVACSTVFYFLLFGAFLTATPAGKLFVNISNLCTRKAYGGAGKSAVVASALFGMISGSAPGNVASIGTIMYEPMKLQGFENRFTGSILAIGGTAGQLIPPVMGAAAFIMVDMAGISYARIMMGAIIPSFVFLAALYNNGVGEVIVADAAQENTETSKQIPQFEESVEVPKDEEETCDHDFVDGTCTKCGEADPDYVPGGDEPIEPPAQTGDENMFFVMALGTLAVISLAALTLNKKFHA